MSNIIPFVSSSPPPMDEDQTFGWDDDDDDDFGNFASAPGFDPSTRREDNGREGFDADWPASDFPSVTSSEKQGQNTEERSVLEDSENICAVDKSCSTPKHSIRPDKQEVGNDDVADDINFADFAVFQDDTSSKSKPRIDSLPLKTTHAHRVDGDPGSDIGVEKGIIDTMMEKSRESTATDSGLFSTDMSPLPQSESVCTSEGDKTMQSDDETFSDVPADSESPRFSHNEPDQLPAHPDHDQEKILNYEHSPPLSDQKPSRQSCGTSLDQNDQLQSTGVNEVIENEEVSDSDKQDSTDRSWQSKLASSASVALKTGEVESQNQQELSNIPDMEDRTWERNAGPEYNSSNSNSPIEDLEDPPLSNIDLPTISSLSNFSNGNSLDASNEDEDNADDNDWAAFETSPSIFTQREQNENGQEGEPDDLVLRKDSIHFDEEQDVSEASSEDANTTVSEKEKSERDMEEEFLGEEGETDDALAQSCQDGNDEQDQQEISEDTFSHSVKPESLSPHVLLTHSGAVHNEADGEFGQFMETANHEESSKSPSPVIPPAQDPQNSPLRREIDLGTEEDSFGDFHGETIPLSEDKTIGKEESEGFGNFSSVEISQEKQDVDNFGSFTSRQAASVEEEEDFGDFNSESLSSSISATKVNGDDFGDVSNKSADSHDVDDFGDFSGQPAASSNSGWADFGNTAKSTASDDDFGSFSSSYKTHPSASFLDANTSTIHRGLPCPSADSTSQRTRETKMKTALMSCFPSSEIAHSRTGREEMGAAEESETMSSDKSKLGLLETILQYGLQFRSASQQTWQVVQHPSKKDPRVKLWGQLQDVDGSPAVIYQWGKSLTNSHLFHTLHIDTQNMLIGHKKRLVPIFATGLSLLEPIRSGRKDREAGGRSQSDQNSVLSPTLVDSTSQEMDRRSHSQEIPAVDFDWSSSGLTNPLTSHSLDLDFLVAQDTQASDKPSVFQSEVLDAPRSSVKSSQPLEDILKSVKPTSVRSRRDDPATSQMSSEALRVLASLPDLTFMQSKVLMFPIKN